jgi:hypothetical protein
MGDELLVRGATAFGIIGMFIRGATAFGIVGTGKPLDSRSPPS